MFEVEDWKFKFEVFKFFVEMGFGVFVLLVEL